VHNLEINAKEKIIMALTELFKTIETSKSFRQTCHLITQAVNSSAVYDAVAIYAWLLEQGYKAENIAFAGDSAGGGIELATMIKCKDDGLPMPAVCAAFSPCTDMTLSGESHKTRAKADPCIPKGSE